MVGGTSCNSTRSSLSARLSTPAKVKTPSNAGANQIAQSDAGANSESEVNKTKKTSESATTIAQAGGEIKKAPRPIEEKHHQSIVLTTARRQPEPAPNTGSHLPSMIGSNLLVRTTAYCHKEADSLPYGKLNAAGGILQYGTTIRSAAADWSRFPLGTKFRIQGQPYEYIIDDYGSALVGTNTIDLYKPTFTAMNNWGVRRVPIQIIEWGCFHKSRQILQSRKHVKGADHVRQMLGDIEARYTGFRAASASEYGPVLKNDRA